MSYAYSLEKPTTGNIPGLFHKPVGRALHSNGLIRLPFSAHSAPPGIRGHNRYDPFSIKKKNINHSLWGAASGATAYWVEL
ncbi:MAG: hypothetical protein PF447_14725 [Spirochaetaceae bacterium]|nr:hypothetical protein [Spirochaetaceae bacterium]